jgi:hypothetical protein
VLRPREAAAIFEEIRSASLGMELTDASDVGLLQEVIASLKLKKGVYSTTNCYSVDRIDVGSDFRKDAYYTDTVSLCNCRRNRWLYGDNS